MGIKKRDPERVDETFIVGLLNALGFAAVLYLFGFFMLKVVPWIITTGWR